MDFTTTVNSEKCNHNILPNYTTTVAQLITVIIKNRNILHKICSGLLHEIQSNLLKDLKRHNIFMNVTKL